MEIDFNLWIIHGQIHVKIVLVLWDKLKEPVYDDDIVLESLSPFFTHNWGFLRAVFWKRYDKNTHFPPPEINKISNLKSQGLLQCIIHAVRSRRWFQYCGLWSCPCPYSTIKLTGSIHKVRTHWRGRGYTTYQVAYKCVQGVG